MDGIRVTAAQNSHYSFAAGTVMDARFKTLSYRFDLPDRSIVYTGDTGPSPVVQTLAAHADILVSEFIDVPATLAAIQQAAPALAPSAKDALVRHLSSHHLSTEAIGRLASGAGVKRVVLTHIVPGAISAAQEAQYRREIARDYPGPITFANDLDRF